MARQRPAEVVSAAIADFAQLASLATAWESTRMQLQIFILALFFGVFTHDMLGGPEASLGTGSLLAVVFIPKLVLMTAYALACRGALRLLGTARSAGAMHWLDRITNLYRLGLLASFGIDLAVGSLQWIRIDLGVGDIVLIDELMVMIWPLLLVVWGWWCYYPVDRRIREASIMRMVDESRPIYPIWSRSQFIVAQVRHQIAMILVPLLLLVGWMELVSLLVPPRAQVMSLELQPILALAGVGSVFLFAPELIRRMWHTAPLPPGELRQRLLEMCRQHHVGVRELLLWHTHGGMINGAVMGLIAPVRYILLTDALLDHMSQKQVEAVMAHELAHVRRRHLFWLLLCGLAALGVLNMAALGLSQSLLGAMGTQPPALLRSLAHPEVRGTLSFVLAMLGWLVAFGWVSRRFERQADTFAVQHMSTQQALAAGQSGDIRVTPEAADTMCQALQQVADLNHIDTQRRSWRHGSIQWRQTHLRNLVGQPIDNLGIDHQIRWLQTTALLTLAGIVAAYSLMGDHLPPLL